MDRDLVDRWIKVNDYESFKTAMNVIKLEGILCGGSAGANVLAAIKHAKDNNL